MYVRMHYTSMPTYTGLQASSYTHANIHVHTCQHICTHMPTYMYTHANIHMPTYTHMPTYSHISTCTGLQANSYLIFNNDDDSYMYYTLISTYMRLQAKYVYMHNTHIPTYTGLQANSYFDFQY